MRALSPAAFGPPQVCRQLIPPRGYVQAVAHSPAPCFGQQPSARVPVQQALITQHPTGNSLVGPPRHCDSGTPGTATPGSAASPHGAISARSVTAPSSCGTPSPRMSHRVLPSPSGAVRMVATPNTPTRTTPTWPNSAARSGFQWQPAATEAAAVFAVAEAAQFNQRPPTARTPSDGESLLSGPRTPTLNMRTPSSFTPSPPPPPATASVQVVSVIAAAPALQRQEVSPGRAPASFAWQRQETSSAQEVHRQNSASPARAVSRASTPPVPAVQRQDSTGSRSGAGSFPVRLQSLPKFQPPTWHPASLPVPESPDPTPLIGTLRTVTDESPPRTLEDQRSLLSSLFPGDLESANHEQRTFAQWPQPDEIIRGKESEDAQCTAPCTTPSSICSYSTSDNSEPRGSDGFDVPPLQCVNSVTGRAIVAELPQDTVALLAVTPQVYFEGPAEQAHCQRPGRSSSLTDELSETSAVFPEVAWGAVLAESSFAQSSARSFRSDPPPALDVPSSWHSSVSSHGGAFLSAAVVSTASTLSPSTAAVLEAAPSPTVVPQPTRWGFALEAQLKVGPGLVSVAAQLQAQSEPSFCTAASNSLSSRFSWPAELCLDIDTVGNSSSGHAAMSSEPPPLKVMATESPPVQIDCSMPMEADTQEDNLAYAFSKLRSTELRTPGTQGSTGGTGGFPCASPCSVPCGSSGSNEAERLRELLEETRQHERQLLREISKAEGLAVKQGHAESLMGRELPWTSYSCRVPASSSNDIVSPTLEPVSVESSPVETFLKSFS